MTPSTKSTKPHTSEAQPYGPRHPVGDLPEGAATYHSDGLKTGRKLKRSAER